MTVANPNFALAVVGGAIVGLGVFLLLLQLVPSTPALGPALQRLHPQAGVATPFTPASRLRRFVQVPHADLAILGRTPERYFATITSYGVIGVVGPGLFSVLLMLIGVGMPLYVPVGVSMLLGMGGAWLAHLDVLSGAKRARDEFTRAMCTYLGLASSQVLDGHGPIESLDRAAAICHGWVFTRIRGALLRAQLQLIPPWDELKRLAYELRVIELSDLADIMRSAGNEGANVYETLRARADSLRDQIRTEALSAAEVRTSKLDIPAALLIFVLLVLLGYPFMTKLF